MSKLALTLVAVAVMGLQGAAQQPLRPGPAVKRLEYFVGHSTSDGTMSIAGTTGKFTAKDAATWTGGGFFVENRSEFTTPFGPGTLLEILGYDAVRKVYTHDVFNSYGQHVASTGTVDGDTWTWLSTDGRSRHAIQVLSPTQFSFKTELSQDGGKTWLTIVEGTTTKTD